MEKNWGYHKLAHHSCKESMTEMKHAEQVIDRILYLEGVPDMAKYDTVLVGDTCEEHLKNQWEPGRWCLEYLLVGQQYYLNHKNQWLYILEFK